MKTKLTLLLMLLLTTALGTRAENEGYTVLSEDGLTLTYYYDDAKADKVGTVKELGYHEKIITKVIFNESFAEARPTSTSGWFSYMYSLQEIVGMENLNTSNVTDMSYMFYICSSLTSLDMSHLDTSNVTTMFYMFSACSSLTSLDLSHFDTSNVTDMRGMFYRCTNLESIDLANFNTSKVKTMGGFPANDGMFSSCNSLTSLDVSHFDTSNVTDMGNLFFSCGKLTNLNVSHFDTSNVTNMSSMFASCSSLTSLDVSHFNTSNVTNISSLFSLCSSLTSLDVSQFDTSNVTSMGSMFCGCSNLTSLDVSHFNTSNVTDMRSMFSGCNSLTSLDVSHFDTSNVTDMLCMFTNCSSLTSLDVSHFDTSNVTSMGSMFGGCSNLTSLDVSHFDTSNVTNMESIFGYCSSLTKLDLSNFDISKAQRTSQLLRSCSALTSLSVSSTMTALESNACIDVGTEESPCLLIAPEGFDYGVDTTGDYFRWKSGLFCFSLKKESYTVLSEDGLTLTYYYDDAKADKVGTIKELGYHDYYITKVIFDKSFAEVRPTSTSGWFSYMYSLQDIAGMENLNTANVTNMGAMFLGCSSLTSLDVSHFDTSNVTDMDVMFNGCRNLTSLDVSNFDTSNVTDMGGMFSSCRSLTSLDVSNFDTSNVTVMYIMFQNCSSLTNLDVSNFDTSNVTNMMQMFMGCSSLTSLDVRNFDLSNVKDMNNMFRGCSSLESLDVSQFNTSNVTAMGGVFYGCSSLTSLDVSNFDLSNVEGTWWLFNNCSSLKELSVSSSMTNISDDACEGVGTTEAPCLLIAPEGFVFGVDTTGNYFQWKSGYFKLEDEGAPVIAELTFDENAKNEIPENGTLVQTVNTMRTLEGGVWNTLCLPFTVTADAMADENHPLHGATIMSLTDAFFDVEGQAQHLMFSQQSEIKAGAPYVVKVSENVVNPTYSNVTIEAQEPVTTQVGDWRMVGIYSPYTFTAADNGIFFLTSGNKFSYVAQPGTMKGMRAFFALDGYSDYTNIVVCFDEATGISQVNATPAGDKKVYDLQGRSINHTPAHGVYIINGKKYVK